MSIIKSCPKQAVINACPKRIAGVDLTLINYFIMATIVSSISICATLIYDTMSLDNYSYNLYFLLTCEKLILVFVFYSVIGKYAFYINSLNNYIISQLVEINKNDCCCTTEDTASHTSEVSDELEHMATMISNKSELNCNDVEQSETNDNNDVEQSDTNDNNDVEQSETNDNDDEGPALYTDEERTKLENYLRTFNKNL